MCATHWLRIQGVPVDEVMRKALLSAPPTRVWAALTDPGQLSTWFGAHVPLEARPGGRATFRWEDGRRRGAVVEVLDPPRRLSLRWLPFEHAPGRDRVMVGTGWIDVTLEETEGGTLLQVVERGTPHPTGAPRAASSRIEVAAGRMEGP